MHPDPLTTARAVSPIARSCESRTAYVQTDGLTPAAAVSDFPDALDHTLAWVDENSRKQRTVPHNAAMGPIFTTWFYNAVYASNGDDELYMYAYDAGDDVSRSRRSWRHRFRSYSIPPPGCALSCKSIPRPLYRQRLGLGPRCCLLPCVFNSCSISQWLSFLSG